MTSFSTLYKRAETRKEGKKKLQECLPKAPASDHLKTTPSSIILGLMTKGIFQSGFVWKIIDQKWPNFESTFYHFDPKTLVNIADEEWDGFCQNPKIVRNATKILSVRENAEFILELEEAEQKTIAEFIHDWPSSELTDLWLYLKKHGSRLGGMTGQYFLRRTGKDSFILSRDVVTSLQELGCDIKDNPTSKREFKIIQDCFNTLHKESGLSYTHLSKILSFASGENYPVETIIQETQKHEPT
jgi:3-methyladenine DNA glycosylase Tag